MRKYNLKRDKAYYEGKVIGIDECISEINALIMNNLFSPNNVNLYILRGNLDRLRAKAVKNYKDIKL